MAVSKRKVNSVFSQGPKVSQPAESPMTKAAKTDLNYIRSEGFGSFKRPPRVDAPGVYDVGDTPAQTRAKGVRMQFVAEKNLRDSIKSDETFNSRAKTSLKKAVGGFGKAISSTAKTAGKAVKKIFKKK